MSKTLEDFYRDLGMSESSGRYNIINSDGYVGKYQMGEAAMIDAGYYSKEPDYQETQGYNRDWTGEWTGKNNVNSLNDFLNNKEAQEEAITAYKKKQLKYIDNLNLRDYVGKEINGIEVT